MNEPHPPWDLVRHFLAIVRAGTLRQAAEELDMSHPTLRRKLAQLEEAWALPLFDRRVDGLHPTPEARELVPLAEAMEAASTLLSRRAAGLSPSLEGWVHVTVPDILISDLLAPAIAAFARKYPRTQLKIETSNDLADLASREADVAIRLLPVGMAPPDDLIAHHGIPLFGAVYGEGQQWVGWDDNQDIRRGTPFHDLPAAGAFNNPFLQRELCKEGLGLALLPCFMAPPELLRRTEPAHLADIWLLVHPDQRRNPRNRLFREAMLVALREYEVGAAEG